MKEKLKKFEKIVDDWDIYVIIFNVHEGVHNNPISHVTRGLKGGRV